MQIQSYPVKATTRKLASSTKAMRHIEFDGIVLVDIVTYKLERIKDFQSFIGQDLEKLLMEELIKCVS